MKYLALAVLVSLGFLAACRKNVKEEPTDYDSIKQHSKDSHDKLDSNQD